MNQLDEMQTYLDDVTRTLEVTRNTLKLVSDDTSDDQELLRECQHNIRWAYKDLNKVKMFLYPEQFATVH